MVSVCLPSVSCLHDTLLCHLRATPVLCPRLRKAYLNTLHLMQNGHSFSLNLRLFCSKEKHIQNAGEATVSSRLHSKCGSNAPHSTVSGATVSATNWRDSCQVSRGTFPGQLLSNCHCAVETWIGDYSHRKSGVSERKTCPGLATSL